jgi:hypothetical protein
LVQEPVDDELSPSDILPHCAGASDEYKKSLQAYWTNKPKLLQQDEIKRGDWIAYHFERGVVLKSDNGRYVQAKCPRGTYVTCVGIRQREYFATVVYTDRRQIRAQFALQANPQPSPNDLSFTALVDTGATLNLVKRSSMYLAPDEEPKGYATCSGCYEGMCPVYLRYVRMETETFGPCQVACVEDRDDERKKFLSEEQAKNGAQYLVSAFNSIPPGSNQSPSKLFENVATPSTPFISRNHESVLMLRHHITHLLQHNPHEEVVDFLGAELTRAQQLGQAGMLMSMGVQQRERSGQPSGDAWFREVYRSPKAEKTERLPRPELGLPPVPEVSLIGMDTLQYGKFTVDGEKQQMSLLNAANAAKVKRRRKSEGKDEKPKTQETSDEPDPDEEGGVFSIKINKAGREFMGSLGYIFIEEGTASEESNASK